LVLEYNHRQNIFSGFFLALKGRNIPAQGNALGKYKKNFSPVRALHKWTNFYYCSFMLRPFRAKIIVMFYPGRCPGLVCYALSGLKSL